MVEIGNKIKEERPTRITRINHSACFIKRLGQWCGKQASSQPEIKLVAHSGYKECSGDTEGTNQHTRQIVSNRLTAWLLQHVDNPRVYWVTQVIRDFI
jgi:hypothetical protein